VPDLYKEIKQLRQRIAQLQDPHYVKGQVTEINRLTAENESLRQLLADKDVEIEQLTKECEEQARLNGMGAERELALRAEIERLRSAVP
jgi:regulator of replication initiation timing